MANQAMGMMMMLLLVGGAVVAFTKRCEWFKICGDIDFPSLRETYKQITGPQSVLPGNIPTPQVTGPGDPLKWESPQTKNANPAVNPMGAVWHNSSSKFARIAI